MPNPLQCLMIKTKDRRKFFTHEKNFPQLIEFSKTFKAEISVVRVQEADILDLSALAPAICDANYATKKTNYELVEVKIPVLPKNSRPKILRTAARIKEYILARFLSGEAVSLKELKKRFKRHKLSTPTLCNHIARVKQELRQKGFHFTKIGAGAYRIEK